MVQCKINGVKYLFLSFDVQKKFFHRVIYHCLNVSVIISVKFIIIKDFLGMICI